MHNSREKSVIFIAVILRKIEKDYNSCYPCHVEVIYQMGFKEDKNEGF